MKILCVTPSYWPAFRFGGIIFFSHWLNREFTKRGIDITVYTTNAGLGNTVPVNKEINFEGIKLTYFSFTSIFEFLGGTGWQFSLPMTRKLRSEVMNFDIVYIFGVWNYPISAASHYCRKYSIPYIISPQGALYPYTIGKKIWKKWPYYLVLTKR